jgi:hypothetical protein
VLVGDVGRATRRPDAPSGPMKVQGWE